MRRLFFALVILVLLVVGAAVIVPALIPSDVLRERTQTAASEALGREVSLAGNIRLQILPRVQVRASDAAIANAPGFSDAAFAEMAELRVSLALLPLLSQRVEVEEFVLVEPVIRLESRNGANNWTFGAPAAETAPASSGGDGFRRRPGALPFDASFGDVRIENGQLTYSDGAQTRRLDALNLAVALPSVDQPVRITGSVAADGRPMQFRAELGSLRGFFEGVETPFDLALTGPLANLSATGRFLESETLSFDGDLDVALPLRALARYLGADLPDGEIFREFTARAQVAGAPGRLALSDAAVTFDDIAANGALALDYSGARPNLTGSVTTQRLDLTPYIPADDAAATSSASGAGVAPWSEERLDLAALNTIDSRIDITAALIKARDVEVSDAALTVTVDRGVMTARLSRFQLYGGSGAATAVVNARNRTPRLSLNANLEGLQAQPFLTAAAGFDRLSGLGQFQLDVSATGESPAALMRSASGAGGFQFNDGAIRGVNLAQLIRTIQGALETRSLPAAFAESEQTDFSSLAGTFRLENGVARNEDLLMLSPLLRVQGAGQVNLAEQSIDYRLTPRAVQSLTGQGGAVDLQGVPIPIRLRGDFNAVSAGIDFEAVAAGLVRAQAGRLLGLPGQSGDDAEPPTPQDALRGLLNRALGGGQDGNDDDGDAGDDDDGGPGGE